MCSDNKITIELGAFEALTILAFLSEFQFEHPKLEALKNAVDQYQNQICKNTSVAQVEDAIAEREVYRLLDKEP